MVTTDVGPRVEVLDKRIRVTADKPPCQEQTCAERTRDRQHQSTGFEPPYESRFSSHQRANSSPSVRKSQHGLDNTIARIHLLLVLGGP